MLIQVQRPHVGALMQVDLYAIQNISLDHLVNAWWWFKYADPLRPASPKGKKGKKGRRKRKDSKSTLQYYFEAAPNWLLDDPRVHALMRGRELCSLHRILCFYFHHYRYRSSECR